MVFVHWSVVMQSAFTLHSESNRDQGNVDSVFDRRGDRGSLRLIDRGIPSPTSVLYFYKSDDDRLDARRCCSMCLHGVVELTDFSGARQDPAVGAGIKWWNHWGCCGAAECETRSSFANMCYLAKVQEAVYECKLRELMVSLIVKNVHSVLHENSAPVNPSIDFLVLRWWFDTL